MIFTLFLKYALAPITLTSFENNKNHLKLTLGSITISFRSILRCSLAALIAASLYSPIALAEQNNAKDVAAIQQVVDRFGAAIKEKDVDAFKRLFYSAKPEQVVWQFAVEDSRLARIQKFKPEARKARHVPTNNYLTAIQGIAAEPLPTEEKFINVKIDTDGEVGSVGRC
ncbi:nuclear transport factor 2 family protein [Gallaecimonas kandeliae]|uniref:nuclear transport factor 2 family protein n=1 Tax=Gallaecimonas kandeliae TaxID=3029055 RepID=UPI002649C8CA|nr:nuclear transport factor 2 family protein [Gallaecimonas kandeliae]WKE65383.1 nuclear transport factor 2 family protein [Gallaecimonas kandeliae]